MRAETEGAVNVVGEFDGHVTAQVFTDRKDKQESLPPPLVDEVSWLMNGARP